MNALGMVYLKTVVTYSISSGLRRGSATLSILTPHKMFVVGKFYCLVFVYSILMNSLQYFQNNVTVLSYCQFFRLKVQYIMLEKCYNIKGKYFVF